MLAYYNIELYVDPKDITTNKLVEGAVKGLISTGCKFKGVPIFEPNRPMYKRFITGWKAVNINDARKLAINWIEGAYEGDIYLGVGLWFEYNFKLDEDSRKEIEEYKNISKRETIEED